MFGRSARVHRGVLRRRRRLFLERPCERDSRGFCGSRVTSPVVIDSGGVVLILLPTKVSTQLHGPSRSKLLTGIGDKSIESEHVSSALTAGIMSSSSESATVRSTALSRRFPKRVDNEESAAVRGIAALVAILCGEQPRPGDGSHEYAWRKESCCDSVPPAVESGHGEADNVGDGAHVDGERDDVLRVEQCARRVLIGGMASSMFASAFAAAMSG